MLYFVTCKYLSITYLCAKMYMFKELIKDRYPKLRVIKDHKMTRFIKIF